MGYPPAPAFQMGMNSFAPRFYLVDELPSYPDIRNERAKLHIDWAERRGARTEPLSAM